MSGSNFRLNYKNAVKFAASIKKHPGAEERRLPKEVENLIAGIGKEYLIGRKLTTPDIESAAKSRKFQLHPEPLTSNSSLDDCNSVTSLHSKNRKKKKNKKNVIYTHFSKPIRCPERGADRFADQSVKEESENEFALEFSPGRSPALSNCSEEMSMPEGQPEEDDKVMNQRRQQKRQPMQKTFQHLLNRKESLLDTENVVTAQQALEGYSNATQKSKKSTPSASSYKARKTTDADFRNYIQKITTMIGDIRKNMRTGYEPPDGAQEWDRTKKRSTEFLTRYTRNFAYSLNQQMKNLGNMNRKLKNIKESDLIQLKHALFVAHQMIFNSLKAYSTNMSAYLDNQVLLKLAEVLDNSVKVCYIHSKCISKVEAFGGSKECSELLETLRLLCEDFRVEVGDVSNRAGELSHLIPVDSENRPSGAVVIGKRPPDKTIVAKKKPETRDQQHEEEHNQRQPHQKKQRHKKTPKKSNVATRYSMYGVHHKPKKLVIVHQPRDKFADVKPRYLDAQFKHRPPPLPVDVQPPVQPFRLKRTTSFVNKPSISTASIKNTPLALPQNEDEIETMIGDMKAPASPVSDEEELCQKSSEKHDCRKDETEMLISDMYKLYKEGNTRIMTHGQFESSLKSLLEKSLGNGVNFGESRSTTHQADGGDGVATHHRKKDKIKVSSQNPPALEKIVPPPPPSYCPSSPPIAPPPSTIDDVNNAKKIHHELFDPPKGRIKIKDSRDVPWIPSLAPLSMPKKQQEQPVLREPKRKQTITISGTKNARLICIKDEEPIDTSPETCKTDKSKCRPGCKIAKLANCMVKHAMGTRVIKMGRLPRKKNLRQLRMIPNQSVIDVGTYKIEYSKHSKKNAMYLKSKTVQPCALVNGLSDKLFDEVLLSVVKEIRVEDTLRGLYESEFQ